VIAAAHCIGLSMVSSMSVRPLEFAAGVAGDLDPARRAGVVSDDRVCSRPSGEEGQQSNKQGDDAVSAVRHASILPPPALMSRLLVCHKRAM
jgi:hypothetical protein